MLLYIWLYHSLHKLDCGLFSTWLCALLADYPTHCWFLWFPPAGSAIQNAFSFLPVASRHITDTNQMSSENWKFFPRGTKVEGKITNGWLMGLPTPFIKWSSKVLSKLCLLRPLATLKTSKHDRPLAPEIGGRPFTGHSYSQKYEIFCDSEYFDTKHKDFNARHSVYPGS